MLNFEELMREQIENMKSSYLKKIEELTVVKEENEHALKRKIFELRRDYDQVLHLKDVVLRQINDMRKYQKF